MEWNGAESEASVLPFSTMYEEGCAFGICKTRGCILGIALYYVETHLRVEKVQWEELNYW
jgi:hypothetical protein